MNEKELPIEPKYHKHWRPHNHHHEYQPFYNDEADYNTNAPSYYDYLSNKSEMDFIQNEYINHLMKRNIEVSDSNTIDMVKKGDWINNGTNNYDDIITLKSDVILSNEEISYYFENIAPHYFKLKNSITELETGLYSPNVLPVLETLAETISEIEDAKYLVYPMFKFDIKPDTDEDINQKLQKAINYVSERNGVLYFQEGEYKLTGVIKLKSNIKILFAPKATIYCEGVTFRGMSTSKGYEGGIQNFIWEGGKLKSSFEKMANGSITPSKFLIHHGDNITFKDIDFEEFVQGHAIDLCGVKNVLVDGCKFIGKHLLTDFSNDYLEAIQLDHSSNLSLGTTDESNFVDRLPTKDFTIKNCESLPIYENETIKYYAPVLVGNHSQFPLCPKNIWVIDNYILDGVPVSSTNWSEKMSGWVHFSTIRDLHVINNRFINTQGVRANAVTMRDRQMKDGIPVGTDYEQTSNIFIEGNYIEGFTSGGQTGMVGIISVRGWYDYGKIDNIYIKDNRFVNCGVGKMWDNSKMRPNDLIRLSQISKATIDGNHVDTCDRFLLIDSADNGNNSSVANLLITNNHVDTITYNTASISIVNGGLLKFSNNHFTNVAGSVRITGDGECISNISNNTFSSNPEFDLINDVNAPTNYKGKFISISNSENESHIISDNIFKVPKEKTWNTSVEQSTILGTVKLSNNNYNTKNEFYMAGQGKRLTLDKYISFLGDSFLTYSGMMTEDTAPVYYPRGDVNKVTFTSWYRALNELGSRIHLLQNNSWSDSQVTDTGESTELSSMLNRCENLAKGEQTPDIIFIQGGKNDFTRNIEIGDYDPYNDNVAPTDRTKFASAYYILLDKIAKKYPLARIVCATIPFDSSGEMPRKRTDGVTLRDFNNVIRNIASVFSAEIIELDKVNFNRYNIEMLTDDGNHPNAEGMNRLKEEYIKVLKNYI